MYHSLWTEFPTHLNQLANNLSYNFHAFGEPVTDTGKEYRETQEN